MRRTRIALLVVLGGLVVGGAGVGCCAPQLALWSMTPSQAFDVAATPRAPDYRQDAAWLSLPGVVDAADTAIPALPATTTPAVDVFYLHPTTSIAPEWNARADDRKVREASERGGTLIQASAFNGTGAVYAPTYRQAAGTAFTEASADGQRAIDVAFDDVVAAFKDFERRAGTARPFVLAGHSQGAFLGERLLREHILVDEGRRPRLVAAYLIGAPIVEDVALRGCRAADETGCVVAYNARGPKHVRNAADFGAACPPRSSPSPSPSSPSSPSSSSSSSLCRPGWGDDEPARLCVNPTLGRVSDELVPGASHGGAVFLDAEAPALLPRFLSSQCRDGRLVVTGIGSLPKRDLMSGLLLQIMGGENFHPIEYQLFWADLRADVARRAAATGPTP